jgi:hypothetical protein
MRSAGAPRAPPSERREPESNASSMKPPFAGWRIFMKTFARIGVALALAVLGAPARAAHVETFTLGVGGDSSGPLCHTYGTPAPVYYFFGGFGPSEPMGTYAGCSIAGGYDSQTTPVGWLSDARADSFAWSVNAITGSTDVAVRHGEASVRASETYGGQPNSSQIAGFESFGRTDDTLTITSASIPAGQTGYIRFSLALSGWLSLTAQSAVGVELPYYDGTVGPYTAFRVQGTQPATVPFIYSATGLGLAGFALSPGAVSGADTVTTLIHPFVFGTARDWKFGLFTYAQPSHNGTTDSEWHMKLTGIEVWGPQGQVLSDFTIASASGVGYGAGGVVDTTCANGVDDDGDGQTDYPGDPGCENGGAASIENPKCQDGLDNDGDGKFDFDGGASANGGVALGAADPQCVAAHTRKEGSGGCGLGTELVLVVAALRSARRRTRASQRRREAG